MRLLGIEWFAGGSAGRPPRLALPPLFVRNGT